MEAPSPRVLKKYGNRRLYDTEASRYVTLAEVEQLIQAGSDIEVVDAKTGEDLTRAVLAQIISERQSSREVLPVAFLTRVIRTGASPEAREKLGEQLLGVVRGFSELQRNLAAEVQKAAAETMRMNPFAAPFGYPPAPPRPQDQAAVPSPAEVKEGAETRAELAELRAELKATQAVLRELIHGRKDAE
ncbi:MAG: polyhydroxyalkanoate synthesis regulator DNA-binding domain-containing protein [Deltaproteobacteria bacterium]|nr:polyhydroxyalkanoate synthesis regulator DNA-binding domain-containing protein [Deltaproteobacteria bacterium]